MSRRRPFRFLCCLLPLAIGLQTVIIGLQAVIIDRVAVSAGNRVITASGIDRQIRVTAFQDGVKPDFSPAARRATAERMVEQKLIEQEQANSRYPLPDPAELLPAIDQFKKDHFKDQAEYQRALVEYGITEQDFKDLLLWQRTLLLFIQVRFEAGAQITNQEVEDYFERNIKPVAQLTHPGQPVNLEDYRVQIEQTLAGKRADQQLDTWLQETRKRVEILYHDEAFK